MRTSLQLVESERMNQSCRAVAGPMWRCLTNGPRTLSFRECLTLVLKPNSSSRTSAVAARLLHSQAGEMDEEEQERAFFTVMETDSPAHLQNIASLAESDQSRLLAAFELGRRYHLFRERNRSAADSSGVASLSALTSQALAKVDAHWRDEPKEWLGFVPVYNKKQIGNLCVVERGVRTHVNTEPAELFRRLLSVSPRSFFLFHNHPSGDLCPSSQDHDLTRRVEDLALRLGVRLLGHWILSGTREREIPFHPKTWGSES